MAVDYRLVWIRDRVLTFLNEVDHQLFYDLLERDGGKVENLLTHFLDDDILGSLQLEQRLFFFYKTYYDKIIEEEIMVAEEVIPEEPPAPPTPPPIIKKGKPKKEKKEKKDKKKKSSPPPDGEADEEGEGGNDDMDEDGKGADSPPPHQVGGDSEAEEGNDGLGEEDGEGDKDKKKSKGKKDKKKGKKSPPTLVEEPTVVAEPQFVYVAKIVEKVIQAPELHAHFGCLENENTPDNRQLIYLLRQTQTKILQCDNQLDAISVMPDHFIIGSTKGNHLTCITRLLQMVLIPAVEMQFREPSDVVEKIQPKPQEFSINEVEADLQSGDETSFEQNKAAVANLMRPSDYRTLALHIKCLEGDTNTRDTFLVEPDDELIESSTMLLDRFLEERQKKEHAMEVAQSGETKKERRDSKLVSIPKKSELIQDMKDLNAAMVSTLNHLQEGLSIEVPDYKEQETTDEELTKDISVVERLETAVENWLEVIQGQLQHYTSSTPEGNGPLGEYDFWNEQQARLSVLVEQMTGSKVKSVLELLKQSGSDMETKFSMAVKELLERYSASRDNVKFLSTILRHLKTITHSISFTATTKALQPLMDGLYMIWILSRHYNKDETLVPFMKKIAWTLRQKVTSSLQPETLFKDSLKNVIIRTKEASRMLKQWKQCYIDTRLKIEVSGRGQRWEFDQKYLFVESEYIASVCYDLYEMASVIQEFKNVFGPELKSIIEDPSLIEVALKKINNLTLIVELTDFDIYKPSCKENWDGIVQAFHKEVEKLEKDGKHFINESFKMLRSSEDALETLLKLKHIQTRDSIKNQLMSKFDSIMMQYTNELALIHDAFVRGKKKPPLLRYQPPYGGAMFWERQLFMRIKKPILTFQKVKEVQDSKFKDEAFIEYLRIGKEMKSFEDSKFESWVAKVIPVATEALKRSVLKLTFHRKPPEKVEPKKPQRSSVTITKHERKSGQSATSVSSSSRKTSQRSVTSVASVKKSSRTLSKAGIASIGFGGVGIAMRWPGKGKSGCNLPPINTTGGNSVRKYSADMTWGEFIKNNILTEIHLRFEVNFLEEIFDIISESELMEYLGFTIPPPVRSLAIQKDRLNWDFKVIRRVVSEYNDTIDNLTTPEVQFIKDIIKDVENHIQPGLTRFNWNTLCLQEYAESCQKVLTRLIATIKQIRRIEDEINEKITQIEKYNLFMYKVPDARNRRFECLEFFEIVEEKRTRLVKQMTKQFNLIGPMLMKMESIVHHECTGTSPLMGFFFMTYEDKIFSTLLRMIVKNLKDFDIALNTNVTIFEVAAVLSGHEIVIRPSPTEVHNIIINNVRDLLERLKLFPRWRNGSCLPCKPFKVQNSDECYIFSFFEDVIEVQLVNDLMTKIQDSVLRIVAECVRKLVRWRKYRSLWIFDKTVTCDKFAAKGPSLADFDEKFSFYAAVSVEVGELPPFEDVYSIRMNLQPIINSIQTHCKEWKSSLGLRLVVTTRESMNEFQKWMTELKTSLNQTIKSLETFKIVLQTITTIQKMTVTAEIRYKEFQDRYHVLGLNEIEVPNEDSQMSQDLESEWQKLYISSLYKAQSFQTTKDRFASITKNQITDFGIFLEDFIVKYEKEGPASVGQDLEKGLLLLEEFKTRFAELDAKKDEFVLAETLFDLSAADYSNYNRTHLAFDNLTLLYNLFSTMKSEQEHWAKTLWVNFNSKLLFEGIERYINEFQNLSEELKICKIGIVVEQKMKEFKNTIPLMVKLKSDALRERHWRLLMSKTNVNFNMAPDKFILENVFAMSLYKYGDTVERIIKSSVKELAVEKGVKQISDNWQHMSFKVLGHFKGPEDRGFVLGPTNDIMQTLEDNSTVLQSMATSQFIGPFLGIVQKLEKSLSLIGEVIDEWTQTQKKWTYLEGIFVGSDIRAQLPEEAKKFDDIDRAFRKIMVEVHKRPNVRECCEVSGRLAQLQILGSGLENCQKSLMSYLDTKRNAFPRFFFLSDDELLSILGSTEPSSIQNHMLKIFDNVQGLEFELDPTDRVTATGMVSCEGELMTFRTPVLTQGRVDEWMGEILVEMRKSSRYITKKAIYEYGKIRRPRSDWMLEYQGMVCLAANQVWWTVEVENVFQKIAQGNCRAMKEYLEQLNKGLYELVLRVRGNLSNNDRQKFYTVLIIDVHARDIIEAFVRDNVISVNEFEWESQLRFSWMREVDNLLVFQCTGKFKYGYEYMGLNGRLVVTPLTERIYLTITQALSMKLGGASIGPAGTGKTETTKDLAKAFGILCLVTNCGEGMDVKAFGKILNGLCQCGAWGCFDEFNRITISVLSVISAQLQTIRNAMILSLKKFNFEGLEIFIDMKAGIFITMNPSEPGRKELLESVKAFFRPVACILPDLEMICRVMLFSEGFLQAKTLAKKMTVLYNLAQEQLSKQCHYDFGLRALKSVLLMAGKLKRNAEDIPEEAVLMRALRDMNIPKFVKDDVPLFLGILKDLFPGSECSRVEYPDFKAAVVKSLSNKGFEILESQVNKVIQVYETVITRHCTMIVGPSGGGKSVIINMLQKAQTALGLTTRIFALNPKACSVLELYGVLDPETRNWTDCLLPYIFREINKPSDKPERRYILFDGDVDVLWVENMNSVMDDNKLLTLANGERIRLQPHCALLFEVGDLSYSSPTTVSRTGMVFVDPKDLGYSPYWKTWVTLRRGTDEHKQKLNELWKRFIPPLIDYVVHGKIGLQVQEPPKLIISQTSLNMVVQFCYMMDAIIPGKSSESAEWTDEVVTCVFILCIYCSIGASIVYQDREGFDSYVKELSALPTHKDSIEKRANLQFLPCGFQTLYDYFIDIENEEWVAWKWVVPNYQHDRTKRFHEVLVPTVDTCRTNWIVGLMHKVGRPVVLVGESGTSKTAILQDFLLHLPHSDYVILDMNFSSRTTSLDVQKNIESAVEKRTKDTYGPPIGKKLIVCIDDLNMPLVDCYGTQQPIALLKLFLEKGGFYDRGKELFWKNIKDTCVLAAMGKAGGGRNEVDQRFISKFSIFNVPFPSDETVRFIYSSILLGHCTILSKEIQNSISTIVDMTIEVYKILLAELPPIPEKFHYTFNLRDLSRITAGLCQIQPQFFNTTKQLVRVWRNEFSRVICDRLINATDQKLVSENIRLQISKRFISDIVDDDYEYGEEEDKKRENVVDFSMRDPLLYGDYRNACTGGAEPRLYEDLLDYDAIYFLFQEILDEYAETHGKINIVLFEDALEHLTRIHRVLRMNRGHVMIVGIGGSGKRSLIRLASYAAGCAMFELTLSKEYNEINFKEDLKELFKQVGIQRKPSTFLFTAAHVIEERFLEKLNNILAVGSVPALFNDDEKKKIIKEVQENAKAEGYGDSSEEIWKYFKLTCSDNLHVALSMSPTGDILRTRCRNFPGLVNNTTVDWIFPWPRQALIAVAKVFLAENPKVPEQFRDNVVQHVVHTHTSVRQFTKEFRAKLRRKNYVTPKQYLDFISTYLRLLEEKNDFIIAQCNRLDGGMQKIAEGSLQLNDLYKILDVQKVAVAKKTTGCEELLRDIKLATEDLNTKKEVAAEKKLEIEEQGRLTVSEKTEAQEILDAALPALEAARQALDELDKTGINELRSFAAPPAPVQTVCECMLFLLGVKEISWKTAKNVMADASFLPRLKDLNCEMITLNQQRNCRAHAKNLPPDLKPINKTAHGLMVFMEAVLSYCNVYREVKPKQEKVEQLEQDYDRSQKYLKKLMMEIEKVENGLTELNDQYSKAINERTILQDKTDVMHKRLLDAEKLIGGLNIENKRWTNELEDLHIEQDELIGNCLLSAAFLSYTGPFSFEFRKTMVYENWKLSIIEKKIPITLSYRLETALSSDVEISRWGSEGLASDELSVQNGILAVRASRFPLCIDPQQQALNWIKEKEKNSLLISTFDDPDFKEKLVTALELGQAFLFQDVDEYVDPIISNVLERNWKTENGKVSVSLGDTSVDVNLNFRLYLTTKLTDPNLNPSLYAQATVINYSVTTFGLEDQLLALSVRNERPDLEQRREELIQETFLNKNLLKSLEDSLLKELSTTKGTMLDNAQLVKTLEVTKQKAEEVSEKLKSAVETKEEIDKQRSSYRTVAQRSTILFFLLSDMAGINFMYQYSLRSYLEVFVSAFSKAQLDGSLETRLQNINNTLTTCVYDYGCLGIFEKDKLLFSFQMATKLEENNGNISQAELDFFLRGSYSTESPPPSSDWIEPENWGHVVKLSKDFPATFGSLPQDIEENLLLWKEWLELDSPDTEALPCEYSSKITSFQRLMIVRCFRIDRLFQSVTEYVTGVLGGGYVTSSTICLDKILTQSSPLKPVLFILSPGSDPTKDLIKLAERVGIGGGKLKHLTLGQGQIRAASNLLTTAIDRGQWLMLQNCHLLIPFLRILKKTFEQTANPHADFRLWLTTCPTSSFPIEILQRSLKVAVEPPNSLKLNLKNTFTKLPPTLLDSCPHQHFKSLVYVLGFFHAVVQERRKYGKIGWNICYDFSESDFQMSVHILDTYLSKVYMTDNGRTPWRSLKYLIGEVVYGGRVLDIHDRRLIKTYMDEYFGDFLFDEFQRFHFFVDNKTDFVVPTCETKNDFISFIDSLPSSNSPNVIGLHPNAEIGYYANATNDMLRHLMELQPQTITSDAESDKNNQVDKICEEMILTIPSNYDLHKIRKSFEMNLTPTTIVLIQELEMFNRLLEVMRKTLALLRKALAGEMGMDTMLDDLASCLFSGKLPDGWRKLIPSTRKSLGGWMEHYHRRIDQYNKWMVTGDPTIVWLSGLHVPQAYLTALVQMACRKNGWSLDRSTVFTEVSKHRTADEVEDRIEEGCYVQGLYLEGARWNLKKNSLDRSLPRVLIEELPILKILPIECHRLTLQNTLRTPVYTTSLRRDSTESGLVFEVDLATKEHNSHFILQGVCLLLNTD